MRRVHTTVNLGLCPGKQTNQCLNVLLVLHEPLHLAAGLLCEVSLESSDAFVEGAYFGLHLQSDLTFGRACLEGRSLGLEIAEPSHEPFALELDHEHLPLHGLTLHLLAFKSVHNCGHPVAPRLVVLRQGGVEVRGRRHGLPRGKVGRVVPAVHRRLGDGFVFRRFPLLAVERDVVLEL